jgi:uncharacterized protein with HEPN domain
MRDPKIRLRDMLEEIEEIQRYSSRGKEAFDGDELVQSWVLRHLQIMGEAARNIPADVQQRAPEVPWTKIIGMRHVLVHDYFRIEMSIAWGVVERDLAPLKRSIQALLDQLEREL